MKKNHSLIMQCALLLSGLILSLTVLAEPDQLEHKTKDMPKDRFEMLASKLKLDEQQKVALKPMLEKLKKEQQDTLKMLDEKQTLELSTILNPNQVQQVKRVIKRSQHHKAKKQGQAKAQRQHKEGVSPKAPEKLPSK